MKPLRLPKQKFAANLPEMMDAEPGRRLDGFFRHVLEEAA